MCIRDSSAPQQKLKKPSVELKGFAKTRLLKPGESQTVSFTLTSKDLASFDPSTSSWIAEAGTYSVKVAASVSDIGSSAKLSLSKDVVAEKSRRMLAPVVELKEIAAP